MPTADKSMIRAWLNRGKEEGATHVIIMCDTFKFEDYPVMVMPGQDARKEVEKRDKKNMAKLLEVYNLSIDISEQLAKDTYVRNY